MAAAGWTSIATRARVRVRQLLYHGTVRYEGAWTVGPCNMPYTMAVVQDRAGRSLSTLSLTLRDCSLIHLSTRHPPIQHPRHISTSINQGPQARYMYMYCTYYFSTSKGPGAVGPTRGRFTGMGASIVIREVGGRAPGCLYRLLTAAALVHSRLATRGRIAPRLL